MPLQSPLAAYRRTGSDLPWGDPVAPHGVPMEGWFWRITDPAGERAAVVLCGSCCGRAGPWTLVALAAAPHGIVRSAICPPAQISADGRMLSVPGALEADGDTLRVTLGDDARLDARFEAPAEWPRRALGALGLAHPVPALGQYWHPHMLGARVDGELAIDGTAWAFDRARGYAEKNWGRGFPRRWWWGQASGVGDDEEACVAFAGGDLRIGPLALAPTAAIVKLNGDLLRLGPPFAHVAAETAGGTWQLRARSARHVVDIEGDANGSRAHRLPVPVPAERRLVDGPAQHFTGRLRVSVRRGRRIVFRGESELAALERGDLSAERV
jgi:hypothetical protein